MLDDDPSPTSPPRVFVDAGRALFLGPGLDLSPHRNATATIAVGLGPTFTLAMERSGLDRFEDRRVALIPAGQRHHLRARGPMAFVYLDPLGDDCAAVNDADLEHRGRRISGGLRRAWTRPSDNAPPVIGHAFELLGVKRRVASGRLAPTLRALDRSPIDFDRIEVAARHAGLSVSRFQHLLREETGLPFRRYRLWRRMVVVAAVLQAGRPLTTAALDAGFASSAHLSAAFRDMFGLAPSTLIAAGTRFDVEPRFLFGSTEVDGPAPSPRAIRRG